MLTLAWPTKDAYLKRLFSSHDFDIEVDVLDLNEKPVASATLLDGQISIVAPDSSGVRRTASITLLDDSNALDFGIEGAWSGTSLWVNRLLRVSHVLRVGSTDVRATCFVGVPTSLARSGAEVDVSLSDKAALANRGSKPFTVGKGMDAVGAVRSIMSTCTGEFRFRFPSSTGRRLSKAYNVGWADEASPFTVAASIARHELGMQLLYAADGALLLRPLPTTSSLTVPSVTAPPSTSADLTGLVNYVQVTGKAQTKKVSPTQSIKTQPQSVATLPVADQSSPESLSRKGVPRYLPLIISDNALASLAEVKARAANELKEGARVKVDQTFSTIPFFHADADDLVTLNVLGADPVVRLTRASIPLGVAGDMTLGRTVLSRKPPRVRSRVQMLRWRKVTTKKKTVWRDAKKRKHSKTTSHTSNWTRF